MVSGEDSPPGVLTAAFPFPHGGEREAESSGVSSYKDTSSSRSGPTLMTSFNHDRLYKVSFSKYCHMGVGESASQETQNSVLNTSLFKPLSLTLSLEGPFCASVKKTRAEIPFWTCFTLEITPLSQPDSLCSVSVAN